MGVAVIAVEWIYANVRLRLTANRTYGLEINIYLSGCFKVAFFGGIVMQQNHKAEI